MPVTIVGNNTPTAGGVVYGDGTNYASTSAGSAGGVLYSAGSSAPAFTTAGTSGQVLQSNGASAPSWVNAISLSGNNAFTGANTFYNSTGQTFGTATSTQDGIIIGGRAGGSSSYRLTLTPNTLAASRTVTLPDGGGNYTVGYINLPAVGTKTGSYTLAVGDVGKYVQIGSGGSITIPTSTFAEGDAISLFNNTTGNITITCSAPTTYIAGTDTIKTSLTLATRGVATILFYSATACVVSGNVT